MISTLAKGGDVRDAADRVSRFVRASDSRLVFCVLYLGIVGAFCWDVPGLGAPRRVRRGLTRPVTVCHCQTTEKESLRVR